MLTILIETVHKKAVSLFLSKKKMLLNKITCNNEAMNKKQPFKFILITVIFMMILIDLNKVNAQTGSGKDGFETIYMKAMADAAYPSPDKIQKGLLAINKKNPALTWKTIDNEDYLLVVSWQNDTVFYPKGVPYNTGSRILWVTTVPEVRTRCTKEKDDDLRLLQRFGMPPTANKKYFIEFWVKPSDLVRPCPDNETSDNQCQLCFPDNVDSLYKSWFNKNRIDSYYGCNLYQQYPWTQLGYSYDWNPVNKTHVGFSEFLVWFNKRIIVKDYYSTSVYCRKK